jgi:hypothetical protein
MFDINSIKDVTTAEVSLKHPLTGELLGATVTLAGPEHSTRKAIEFAKQRKLRAAVLKTGRVEASDPEEDILDAVEKLAACTLGWTGISEEGLPLEFSKAAAAKLYGAEGNTWLRDQVFAAMDERSRFIKACATS